MNNNLDNLNNPNNLDNYVDINENDEDENDRRERFIVSIINNGGFNLNPIGGEGRYTRSHHFQNMDEWAMVFGHIVAVPVAVHETSMFVHNHAMRAIITQRSFAHDTFPEVVLIPLPCTLPNFRRCILHVEEFNPATNHLTGRFIPIHMTYHRSHPVAQGIARMFEVEAHSPPRFQRNESLLLMTTANRTAVEVMCRCLVQPVNDFDAYDALIDPNEYENMLPNAGHRHILPDPRAEEQANAAVLAMMPVPERDITPMEAQEQQDRWRSIVYPRTNAGERRIAYSRYAAEQINIHRYLRILWGNNHPNFPNPFDLPHNIELNRNIRPYEHVRENNPADRGHEWRGDHHIMGNAYIQALYDTQDNMERAMIASMDVRLNQYMFPFQAARL